MLKLNYKPVWSESIEALAELIRKFQYDFWKIAESQLKLSALRDNKVDAMIVPNWIEDYSGSPSITKNASTATGDYKSTVRFNRPFSTKEWNCFQFDALVNEKKSCELWNYIQLKALSKVRKVLTHNNIFFFLNLLFFSPNILASNTRQSS